MTFRTLSPRLILTAAVLALPFVGSGCGRTACFTWSRQEGTCPAQSEAMAFFSSPSCPGRVTSVESEATSEVDGSLCCYAVIESDQAGDQSCQGFGGANNVDTSVGDGDSGFVASTVGAGDPSGGPMCARCAEVLAGAKSVMVCPSSTPLLKTLLGCACGGSCAEPCSDNFCQVTTPTEACFACIKDLTMDCVGPFDDCANDL